MSLGSPTTSESLRRSTRAVLALAESARDIRTLAFPAVGTGIAGFGLRQCAEIMLGEVHDHLAAGSTLREIHFVLFGEKPCRIFREVWDNISSGGD